MRPEAIEGPCSHDGDQHTCVTCGKPWDGGGHNISWLQWVCRPECMGWKWWAWTCWEDPIPLHLPRVITAALIVQSVRCALEGREGP